VRKAALILVFFTIVAMPDNIVQRGVNNVIEYLAATGSGTDSVPHVPTVGVGNVGDSPLDVAVQDQTSENISLFLGNHLDTLVTINSNTTINQEIVEMSFPTTPPLQGYFVCMKEDSNFSQVEIILVVAVGGDDYSVSLGMPLDFAFTTDATVCLQDCDMNVDGSLTPVEYFISPVGLGGMRWDITRMIVTMYHSSAGDDGLFGNLTKLTNGNYFRVENGVNKNLFNARENADWRVEGYDVAYSTRSGGLGSYGTAARITFNGMDKRGVVLRLSSSSGDKFTSVVRDDIDALSYYRVKIQGHVVED